MAVKSDQFKRKWVVGIVTFFNITSLLFVWFLTNYNDGFWLVNILAYSIPIFLSIIFFTIIILFFCRKYYLTFILLLAGLVLLSKPILETVSFGYLSTAKFEKDECPLNIMTFNVSTFNNHRTEAFMKDDSIFKTDFFNYLRKVPDELDILCLQEFHHDDGDNQRIVDQIVKYTGANYFYTVPIWMPWNGGFFGIITLSKYPIVNKGTLFIGPNELNRGIFTDILYQNDTLRIINIHLHSMNIRWSNEDTVTSYKDKTKLIISSLKEGSEESKFQIDQVLKVVSTSPYPVILCGDFNTFPYGYSYQKVKKVLRNSFEESGKGFGYTLNLPPYLVRLDNQFSSDEIIAIESKVIRKIKQSDHFPLVCRYIIRK